MLLSAGGAASLGLLAYFLLPHLPGVLREAGAIDWRMGWAAMACAVASYLMMGLALWEVLGLLRFRLPFLEVLGIVFVSSTANYVVSSAGISGFALKAHLLRKRDVPYGATVTASVLSTGLHYFVLMVFIGQGLGFLLLRMRGMKFAVLEGTLGLGVVALTSVPLLMFFFNRDLRSRLTRGIFRLVNHLSFFFSKREIPREDFQEFERQLEDGLGTIHRDKGRLTRAIAYTCLDWVFAMLVLYFSVQAVGEEIGIGHLSAGFAVGQATTLIPVLPAGLGAMEGAMAKTLEGLGLPFEEALTAALLYRIAYYVMPGLSSVFLLWGLRVSEPELILDTAIEDAPEEKKRRAAHGGPGRQHP